jgi:prophage tail gpP-like protein
MILKIGTQQITDFNEVNVELKYDSVASTFSFQYRYDGTDPLLKLLNTPASYADCTIEYQNPETGAKELLITGTVLNHGFDDNSTAGLNGISGYSKTGVLEDCNIPVSLYPLQSDGKSLRQIVEKLIQPFGISLIVSEDVSARANSVIDVSTAEPSDTIKGYLATIANQKDILLSHDSAGNLLLTKSRPNATPKYNFGRQIPISSSALTVDGQQMHSEITVIKQAGSEGGNAGQSTVKNPYVSKFRPSVKIQSSGDDNSTSFAAKSALANELRAISLTINVDTWTDNNGLIWRPNTVITIENSELMLNKITKFFIESVQFTGNESQQVASLKCVVPEVHNTQTPVNIFA